MRYQSFFLRRVIILNWNCILQERREFVENAFLESLITVRDQHPGVRLLPCFPFPSKESRLDSLKHLNLFHDYTRWKNVCVVSPVRFSRMIGADTKKAISCQTANVTSCLLHNAIMNPHLLDPSTYKYFPLVCLAKK